MKACASIRILSNMTVEAINSGEIHNNNFSLEVLMVK
jgi:hypothetical protein